MNAGSIFGIVLLCVVFVVLIVFVLWWFLRPPQKKKAAVKVEEEEVIVQHKHLGNSHKRRAQAKQSLPVDHVPEQAKLLVTRNRLTQKEKDLFLKLHNDYRKLHDLPPLAWDDRLARIAQAYTDKLVADGVGIKHPDNTSDDRLYLGNGADGQNLSEFVCTHKTPGAAANAAKTCGTISSAIGLWTDECHDYDPDKPDANDVGHLTQMLWRKTDKVGCAQGRDTRGNKTTSIYTCHYNTSGNWLSADGGYENYKQQVPQTIVCLKKN